MDKQKTGALIKAARLAKNYTQNELGDLLGVTNKAVSRWENGESFPDIGVLEALSQALDLKIQDIVTGESDNKDDSAIVEIVRIAKLQDHEKNRKSIVTGVGCAVIIFLAIFGIACFSTCSVSVAVSRIICGITFAVTALLLILYRSPAGVCLHCFKGRQNKFKVLIPVITYVAQELIFYISLSLVKAGKSFLGLATYQFGPVLVSIFEMVFLLNLAIIVITFVELLKEKQVNLFSAIVALGALLLSCMNSVLLYDMDTFATFSKNVLMNLVIITVGVTAAGLLKNVKNC